MAEGEYAVSTPVAPQVRPYVSPGRDDASVASVVKALGSWGSAFLGRAIDPVAQRRVTETEARRGWFRSRPDVRWLRRHRWNSATSMGSPAHATPGLAQLLVKLPRFARPWARHFSRTCGAAVAAENRNVKSLGASGVTRLGRVSLQHPSLAFRVCTAGRTCDCRFSSPTHGWRPPRNTRPESARPDPARPDESPGAERVSGRSPTRP